MLDLSIGLLRNGVNHRSREMANKGLKQHQTDFVSTLQVPFSFLKSERNKIPRPHTDLSDCELNLAVIL